MSIMKLPGGMTIKFRDESEPKLLDDRMDSETSGEPTLESSIRELMNGRAQALKTFHVAASLAPDPTLYELVEEWDRDSRKIRWFYRKR